MVIMRAAHQVVCFLILIASQVLSQTLFAHDHSVGFSLKLITSLSPDFRFNSPAAANLTYQQRLHRVITASIATESSHHDDHRMINNSSDDQKNIRLPVYRDNYYVAIQLQIGSTKTNAYMLLATGGGLVWTQCQPCVNCYPMRVPFYNSRASSTYRSLPCTHSLCSGPNRRYDCVNNVCVYQITYSDGSKTKGVASYESFYLPIDRTGSHQVNNFIFGCSKESSNFAFAPRGNIAGILGLSRAPDSFITQLAAPTANRFSYCFAPFTEPLRAPGALRFGNDIPHLPGTKTTTFLAAPPSASPWTSHYYFLDLHDISVAGTPLGFTAETFRIRADGSGGCIIDSGALIPRIDEYTNGGVNAFQKVMERFEKYYNDMGLKRVSGSAQGFALCYELPPGKIIEYATITYIFGNSVDYIVDGKYAHYFSDEGNFFCVALTNGNGKTVVGAWHQQNVRFTYDNNANQLQYAPVNCAADVF